MDSFPGHNQAHTSGVRPTPCPQGRGRAPTGRRAPGTARLAAAEGLHLPSCPAARMPAPPQRPALTPPSLPLSRAARRSSGNTMEAAPQPRPRPGGASTAAAGPLLPPPPPEQERKLEQEKLSGVVKSVHRRLRKKYREGNRGGGGRPLRAAPLRSPHRGSRNGAGGGPAGSRRAVAGGGEPPPAGGSARIGVSPPRAWRGGEARPPPSRCRRAAGRLGRGPLPKGVCRRWGGVAGSSGRGQRRARFLLLPGPPGRRCRGAA